MCSINASSSSNQCRLRPILVSDDTWDVGMRHGCKKNYEESENFTPSDDECMKNTSRSENGWCKWKDFDKAVAYYESRVVLSSTPSKPMTESSNVSSSNVHMLQTQSMNATQQLSALQRMLAMEEATLSLSADYMALKEADQSFHKQTWRERVAQWCYDVLDYLEEPRDVAAVAMNIMDRYLAVVSKQSPFETLLAIGEFDYEVISFTSLFLAIRVSGANKELEISELLQLSSRSGAPQVRHIVAAGNSMLDKLSWDNQILTPNYFLRKLVALLMIQYYEEQASSTKAISSDSLSNLAEFASYLVEVSVCDLYFSAVAPSKIAFGALTLAMMCNLEFFDSGCIHEGFLSKFFEVVNEQSSMNIECPEMNSILSRLLHVYSQSEEAGVENIGREYIERERPDDNGSHHSSIPHIIIDEAEENISVDAISKSKPPVPLQNEGHRVNTNTNQSRPVSPLPHGFR